MILPALVAFSIGIAGMQLAPRLPPTAASLGLIASAFVLVYLVLWPKARRARISAALVLAAALMLGAGYAGLRAEARLSNALPEPWAGQDIELIGVIDELPTRYSDAIRFAFRVERVATPGAKVPSRVSLSWSRPRGGEIAGEALPDLHAGERWRWHVRLQPPHGYANGHGFDLEAWMLENDLQASGSIRVDAPMQRLAAHAGAFSDHVNRLREAIRARIDRTLPEHPARGVLAALTIGDQRAVPAEQWALYNQAAISHLLSISGAHVTLFAAWVAALVLFAWRRSPALCAKLPAQKAAAVVAVSIAFLYALLAGFQVPAQRTCLMLAVAAAGLLLDRRLSPWLILAYALAAVLVADPWAVLAVGFWFSFVAVALLIYLSWGRYGGRTGALPLARQLVLTQLLMAVGLAPITVFLFGQISLVGPIVNAAAIPLVTLFVVPLALLWLVLPIDGLLHLAAWGVEALTALCRVATAHPAALWVQHAPPAWTVVLALLGVFYLFAPPGWPWRWAGLLLWLPIFTVTPLRPAEGEFRLTALDVGQGTAVAIETARAVVLYDTGPRWNDVFDAGNRLIVPWLRATDNARLAVLVLSHLDLDHAGGAASVLSALPVGRLIANLDDGDALSRLAARRGIERAPCLAGMTWTIDGVRFDVLAPGSAEDVRDASANDGSCVLAVTSASGFRALLPGDAERAAEARLVERVGPALRADVLVAGHHGARTSSTDAFLDAVSPAQVIVTAGFGNRYGHPHAETLARLAARGILVHRTDRSGAIRFESAAGRAQEPDRMREAMRRYWRGETQR